MEGEMFRPLTILWRLTGASCRCGQGPWSQNTDLGRWGVLSEGNRAESVMAGMSLSG